MFDVSFNYATYFFALNLRVVGIIPEDPQKDPHKVKTEPEKYLNIAYHWKNLERMKINN